MKRAAIIVGSPGHSVEAPPFLVGIQADTISYERFLLSDAGGAWEANEIHQFWHPSRDALRTFLKSLYVDYAVTVFCGHGWRQDGRPAILLRPNEGMWLSEFHTQATRELTIVDACQVDEEASFLLKEAHKRFGAGLGGVPDTYRASCRAIYDAAVSAVGEQRTIMYGCKIGQTSGENPLGGYFSQTLLQLSERWGENARQGASRARHIMNVREIFDMAAAQVKEEHYPQEPMLESGRSPRAFPFVVA